MYQVQPYENYASKIQPNNQQRFAKFPALNIKFAQNNTQ
jgi:hypothetical protein